MHGEIFISPTVRVRIGHLQSAHNKKAPSIAFTKPPSSKRRPIPKLRGARGPGRLRSTIPQPRHHRARSTQATSAARDLRYYVKVRGAVCARARGWLRCLAASSDGTSVCTNAPQLAPIAAALVATAAGVAFAFSVVIACLGNHESLRGACWGWALA